MQPQEFLKVSVITDTGITESLGMFCRDDGAVLALRKDQMAKIIADSDFGEYHAGDKIIIEIIEG